MKSVLALCLVICALDSTFGQVQVCPGSFTISVSDSQLKLVELVLKINKNVKRNGMCDVSATAQVTAVAGGDGEASPPRIKTKRRVPCDRDYCTIVCLEQGGSGCGQEDYSYYTG